MKISRKVGTGLMALGLAGVAVSYVGVFYFTGKLKDVDKISSAEHVRVAEIERELSMLRDLGCAPVEYAGRPQFREKSIDKKVQPDLSSGCDDKYRSLEEEKNTLMQGSSYQKVEKQKEVYFNHALGFGAGGVPLSLFTFAGGLAVKRRGEELNNEKIKNESA